MYSIILLDGGSACRKEPSVVNEWTVVRPCSPSVRFWRITWWGAAAALRSFPKRALSSSAEKMVMVVSFPVTSSTLSGTLSIGESSQTL